METVLLLIVVCSRLLIKSVINGSASSKVIISQSRPLNITPQATAAETQVESKPSD